MDVDTCVSQMTEVRSSIARLISLYIEQKNDCQIKMKEGDQLYYQYAALKIRFKALSALVSSTSGKKTIGLEDIKKQNEEIISTIENITSRLNRCSTEVRKIKIWIDVMEMKIKVEKLGPADAALDLEEELRKMEDELDLDEYQAEIIKPPSFLGVRECEEDLDRLIYLQNRMLDEYDRLDTKCSSKMKSIAELRSQYQELDGHYEGLKKKAGGHETSHLYLALLQNETLQADLKRAEIALKECDANIREINKHFTALKVQHNSYRASRKDTRGKQLEKIYETTKDLSKAVTPRVSFDPLAKKTSGHRLYKMEKKSM